MLSGPERSLRFLNMQNEREEPNGLMRGFLEKAIVNLLASYMQSMNITLLGSGLDANYIYNGILGALSAEFYRKDRDKLMGAEEQILCSLIGHRLAANFSGAFSGIGGYVSSFGFLQNMFP